MYVVVYSEFGRAAVLCYFVIFLVVVVVAAAIIGYQSLLVVTALRTCTVRAVGCRGHPANMIHHKV